MSKDKAQKRSSLLIRGSVRNITAMFYGRNSTVVDNLIELKKDMGINGSKIVARFLRDLKLLADRKLINTNIVKKLKGSDICSIRSGMFRLYFFYDNRNIVLCYLSKKSEKRETKGQKRAEQRRHDYYSR